MRLYARSLRRPAHWLVLLLFALGLAPLALAQAPEPPEPAAPPQEEPADEQTDEQAKDLGPILIQIDLDRLLFETRGNLAQDPVWRVSAPSGRQIMLLPFRVDNVHRVNKLSDLPISIRSGRFIGFVIPKPDQARGQADAMDFDQVATAEPDALQRLLFGEDPGEDALTQGDADTPDSDKPDAEEAEPVPENAPRLAREITLHPDGTVQWEMDRRFHASELQSASEQNLYPYKIDARLLRAAQPERADRLTRQDGEDSRAYAQRKREHLLAEREKQQAYRALRDTLRDLPESFREPAPVVLYAAIDVPQGDTLELQGPAPLPWELGTEKKQLMEQLARGGQELLGEQGAAAAGRYINLIQGHALDARAIAIASARGTLAGRVKPGDPGYEVLSKLMASEDQTTRRIALYGAAKVVPPTLASAQLIGLAGEAAVGEERKMLSFASLGKLFASQADEPDTAGQLMAQVSRAIADPDGPSAPRIVEQVLDSISQSRVTGRAGQDDKAVAIMVDTIDLTGVSEQEVQGVAAAIIRQSPSNPVAAGWLDAKLLGSADQAVVDHTLELLAQTRIEPAKQEGSLDPSQDAPTQDTDTDADTDALVLNTTIPMGRADHALLALLDSTDATQSGKAWAVLDRFHLALAQVQDAAAAQPGVEPGKDPSLTLFEAVLAKALALEETPPAIVGFIVNQQHPAIQQVAADRLVALLADRDVDQAAAAAATSHIVASPQDYSQAIRSLKSAEKLRVVDAMYRSGEQAAPLMAGLIADNGQTLTWLTSYLKVEGQLPTPSAWAKLAADRGEGALLQDAGSADPIVASAAAAALVVSVGGSPQQQQSFAQTVGLMQARTPEMVRENWSDYRGKIFAAVYEKAQGTYRMIATLSRADAQAGAIETDQPGEAADAPPPPKRVELGLVELRAQGTKLSLSVEAVALAPVPDRLGIRIEKPASLRSFDKPELAKLPLDNANQPIDLLPEADGVWAGEIRLPDGQTLGVRLEPAG